MTRNCAPVEGRDFGKQRIPSIVADHNTASPVRRIERATRASKAVEPPTLVIALVKLHLVVLTADLTAVVDEHGAVENVFVDLFGEAKHEADIQLASQIAKAA